MSFYYVNRKPYRTIVKSTVSNEQPLIVLKIVNLIKAQSL